MGDQVHIPSEGEISKLIVKLESKLYWKNSWQDKYAKPMLDVQGFWI